MGNSLENALEVFCGGTTENETIRKMFKRLGKIYYKEVFEENIKKGYEIENAKDYSLVDTVRYLFRIRDYYSNEKKMIIFLDNYLKEAN